MKSRRVCKNMNVDLPKLSDPCMPEGPGKSPGIFCNPKNDEGKVGVREWSIEPLSPSMLISPASEAAVSLLLESSPALWACNDAKSECF